MQWSLGMTAGSDGVQTVWNKTQTGFEDDIDRLPVLDFFSSSASKQILVLWLSVYAIFYITLYFIIQSLHADSNQCLSVVFV